MHAVYHIIELLKSPIGLLAKKGQFLVFVSTGEINVYFILLPL